MNIAEEVAAKLCLTLIGADESARIRAIGETLVQMRYTPHEIRFLMNDEDFLPDALLAFRCRFEKPKRRLDAESLRAARQKMIQDEIRIELPNSDALRILKEWELPEFMIMYNLTWQDIEKEVTWNNHIIFRVPKFAESRKQYEQSKLEQIKRWGSN